MKTITLTRGMVTTLDNDDYETLKDYHWIASGIGYIYRNGKGTHTHRPRIYLHREIMNAQPGQEVDHVDGNPLNNTRANLRIASHRDNLRNMKRHKDNAIGYKGVHRERNSSLHPWRAQIYIDGRNVCIGRFVTAEEAARAYDTKARKIHGEFAHTNF